MISRECPFCGILDARPCGNRGSAFWATCTVCGSVFRNVSRGEFDLLRDTAGDEETFVPRIVEDLGEEPRHDRWRWLDLPGSRVLELGPGTGHVLAAARHAGCEVWGVEPNVTHRAYIESTWGIDTVVPALDDLPAGKRFDAIVSINMLEHVRDVQPFLADVGRLLAPDGKLFVSTVNASCGVWHLVGPWWSMCKEVDHVSFPTAKGLALAARAAGLRVSRTWSTELPLETPISVAVAARDYVRERRRKEPVSTAGVEAAGVDTAGVDRAGVVMTADGRSHAGRQMVRWVYRIGGDREPTARLMSRIGRAASIKAVMVPAG